MPELMTYPKQRRVTKVPDYLVKEVIEGKPVYYKGYKSVLRKEKTLEEIMGISSLQSIILWYLSRIVLGSKNIDDRKYFVFTGESGLHIERNSNFSGDILVYERTKNLFFDNHYFNIPPIINIEIDIDIDNSNFSDFEYVQYKTKSLLNFGVKKVIWILSKTRQILVAEVNSAWILYDWSENIEVLNNITFNIAQFIEEEGIEYIG
ncbi:MAG: Uma2 family endonuclease [Spirosomaceae bacterium]|jgi:hypothetical protein|nr:Uma2 family endonuclease [Spirosomataceae bacterium]